MNKQSNNNIPSHWQVKKLGEVADYINGRAFKPTEWEDSGRKIVRIQNLNKSSAPYNYSSKEFEEKYIIRKGDLLYAWSASLGVYIWNNDDAWLNQHIFKVIPKSDCDKKYLFYTLEKVTAELYSKAHGSGMVHVTKGKFEDTKIPFPPLPEQHAIVSKIEELLSELDNGVQQLRTAAQQLKVYRQSLLKAAFEGRLTNKEVKDGELPEGWKISELKEICLIKRGKSKHRPRNDSSLFGGKYPFIQTGDIRNANGGYIKNYSQTYSDKGLEQSKLWNKGTLCITIAANIGETAILGIDACFPDSVVGLLCNEQFLVNEYTNYFFISHKSKLDELAPATAQKNINVDILEKVKIPLPTLIEQHQIVEILESKLTVCDNIEETIATSLQQAETLRQSILKKAFEGKLVKSQSAKVVAKPKNEYFYQMQLLALIAKASKQHSIEHGEMTLAKYAYLLDKVYSIPTYYDYNRWHLGPYPPEMKKAINNKQYFARKVNHIVVVNEDKLLKYTNPYETNVIDAIDDLASIFEKYPVKERADKTELLATVCKVVEDIKTTDIIDVRKSMQDWKIELDNCPFKNKAEKFSIEETEKCLKFLAQRGWIAKLINKN